MVELVLLFKQRDSVSPDNPLPVHLKSLTTRSERESGRALGTQFKDDKMIPVHLSPRREIKRPLCPRAPFPCFPPRTSSQSTWRPSPCRTCAHCRVRVKQHHHHRKQGSSCTTTAEPRDQAALLRRLRPQETQSASTAGPGSCSPRCHRPHCDDKGSACACVCAHTCPVTRGSPHARQHGGA